MFFYLNWQIKKRTSASGMKEHRTETAKLIAELNSVTDRDLQLIEDRIVKLKEFLEKVDKRIAIYENDLEEHSQSTKPSGETLYTTLGRGIRSALKTPEDSSSVPLRTEHPFDSRQLSLALHSSAEPQTEPVRNDSRATVQNAPITAAPIPTQPIPAMPVINEPLPKPPSKKQIRAYIDSLANEGFSPQEIATRLEISVAEVNLAMNLRRNVN